MGGIPRALAQRAGSAVRFSTWWQRARLLGTACRGWIDDDASRRGAAIAFYTTLSLAPFLLVMATVAALFLGAEEVQSYVVSQSGTLVGSEGGALLAQMLKSGSTQAKGLAAVIGFATTLAGATAGFAELQTALNAIFRVPERHGLRATVATRVRSLLLVAAVGLLLVGSLALTALVSRGVGILATMAPFLKALAFITNEAVTLVIAAILFALVLKVLPDRHVPWRHAMRGGLLAATLFQIAKVAIGWYVGHAAGAAVYGAAASLVVLMLWIYFSAQVFLLGAEIAAVSLRAHEARVASGGADQSANGRITAAVAEDRTG